MHRSSQARLARNQSDMLHLISLIEDHKLFPKPPWPMHGQLSCHHDPHQSNFPKRWKGKWTTKKCVHHADGKCILYTVLMSWWYFYAQRNYSIFVAKLARLFLTFLSLSDVLKSLWKLKIPQTQKRRQGTSKKDDKKNKNGRTYHWETVLIICPFISSWSWKKKKEICDGSNNFTWWSGSDPVSTYPIRTETN